MLALTQHTLNKLELVLKELGFRLRYEKGNFKTGSCFIMQSKVIVINKFGSLEQKINSLVEILLNQQLDEFLLNDKQRDFLNAMRQTRLEI